MYIHVSLSLSIYIYIYISVVGGPHGKADVNITQMWIWLCFRQTYVQTSIDFQQTTTLDFTPLAKHILKQSSCFYSEHIVGELTFSQIPL